MLFLYKLATGIILMALYSFCLLGYFSCVVALNPASRDAFFKANLVKVQTRVVLYFFGALITCAVILWWLSHG